MVNVESVTSVQDIIDALEKFDPNCIQRTMFGRLLVSLGAQCAALDILQYYNDPHSQKTAKEIIDYHANRTFILGYGITIKEPEEEFSNEVVKNLAGEELYSRINYIKISISYDAYDKFLSGQINGWRYGEFIQEIGKIMNDHLTKIFMAGYMIRRMEENTKNMVNVESVNTTQDIIDALGTVSLKYVEENSRPDYDFICLYAQGAASAIFEKFINSCPIEEVAITIDYYSNKIFMHGCRIPVKDPKEFSNEAVKRLTDKKLYSCINDIKRSILDDCTKFLSEKLSDLAKEELISGIEEITKENLTKIFMIGYMLNIIYGKSINPVYENDYKIKDKYEIYKKIIYIIPIY